MTELVPSGLVAVGVLDGLDRSGERASIRRDVTYPKAQAGQRVVFCARVDPNDGDRRLRYVARVITIGTYVWEPAIVESRSGANRASIIPAQS